MDISTVVVVITLIALSLGAVTWMEIHSRKNSSKKRGRDSKRIELREKGMALEYSPLLSLRLNGTNSRKTRGEKKSL
jgi:hypothetical protein